MPSSPISWFTSSREPYLLPPQLPWSSFPALVPISATQSGQWPPISFWDCCSWLRPGCKVEPCLMQVGTRLLPSQLKWGMLADRLAMGLYATPGPSLNHRIPR